MLTIESLTCWLVDIPTIRPHKLSMATMGCQTLTLVRMQCAQGVVGWGEATTIGGLSYGRKARRPSARPLKPTCRRCCAARPSTAWRRWQRK